MLYVSVRSDGVYACAFLCVGVCVCKWVCVGLYACLNMQEGKLCLELWGLPMLLTCVLIPICPYACPQLPLSIVPSSGNPRNCPSIRSSASSGNRDNSCRSQARVCMHAIVFVELKLGNILGAWIWKSNYDCSDKIIGNANEERLSSWYGTCE